MARLAEFFTVAWLLMVDCWMVEPSAKTPVAAPMSTIAVKVVSFFMMFLLSVKLMQLTIAFWRIQV